MTRRDILHWFLFGILCSIPVAFLLAGFAVSLGMPLGPVHYLEMFVITAIVLVGAYRYRQWRRAYEQRFLFRSRELRCRWPRDASMRLRRTPERRTAVVAALG